MPRHASASRTLLQTPTSTLNLLPASLVHLHNDGAGNSNKASLRRRQILKHIPQIEAKVAPDLAADANATLTLANAGWSSSSSSLASNLGEFGAKVGSSLPVVRAGATFLNTLHTSVALSAALHPPSNPASAPPSPYLFPQLHQPQSSHIPTVSSVTRRLRARTMATHGAPVPTPGARVDGLSVQGPDALPSLDFALATKDEERVDALKLVADSVAQRRQVASQALMTHPYFFAAMTLFFGLVYQYMFKDRSDIPLIVTTCVGVLMAGFVAIRGAVSKYIDLAEGINYKWLDDDEIVLARWGDGEKRAVIGAVVYKLEKAVGAGNGRKGKKVAVVRAWTTRRRERGNGVGKGLIEETVKQAKKQGAEDVRWDDETVYAERVLPKWANSGFEEGLKETRKKLEGYVREFLGGK